MDKTITKAELIITDYGDYKRQMDSVMKGIVEDFVLIGYLLRKAKEEPDILEGSGYADYKEFAKAEYGLEESTVSRFININIKYGDGANLLPQYQGFGRAKLQDMLSLPESIIEEIPQDTTRAEITEIKKEVEAEQKVTPIEAALEAPEYDESMTLFQNFIITYFQEHKEEFLKLRYVFNEKMDGIPKAFVNTYFPTGSGVMRARVPGKGKYMLTVKSAEVDPVLTNMRTEEKQQEKWDDIAGDLVNLTWEPTKAGWEEFYGEKWEIAPVQFMNPPEKVKVEGLPKENLQKSKDDKPENDSLNQSLPEDARKTDETEAENAAETQQKPAEAYENARKADENEEKTQQGEEIISGDLQKVNEKAEESCQEAAEKVEGEVVDPEEVHDINVGKMEDGQQETKRDIWAILREVRDFVNKLEGAMNESNRHQVGTIAGLMIDDLKEIRDAYRW